MSKEPLPSREEQGELYVSVVPEGAKQGKIINAPEGGVFPSDVETDDDHITMAAYEADRERAAQATRNRSAAQKGKHTVAAGESPKPGDVLSSLNGPQPVTWTNLNAAKVVVAEQQAKQAEAAKQPTLFPDARQLAGKVAAEHNVETVLAGPDTKKPISGIPDVRFKLDTLSKRLEVIVDQAFGAKFIPATKAELTNGLQTVEEPDRSGSVHRKLMTTHDKQISEVEKKGYSRMVGSWEGRRAVVSRVYEMADCLADAKTSFQLLSELQRTVSKTPDLPTVSVKEIYQDDEQTMLGLRVLARDLLILELKDHKLTEDALGFKSMTARETRTYKRPELPILEDGADSNAVKTFNEQRQAIEEQVRSRTGAYSDDMLLRRDKTLHSPFDPTAGVQDEKLEAYIDKFMTETTIGQLRRTKIAARLASLQQNRYWHWRRSIADVRGNPYQQVVVPILEKYPAGLVAA